MTKLRVPPPPPQEHRHVNGRKTRALIVVVLVIMLAGYGLLAWQNWGIAQQGALTKGMVERIVEKKTTETIEQRIAPLEVKTDKTDARADRAEKRADKAADEAKAVSKKQRHVERVVKPLLPLAQNPAVVQKIVEEHAGLVMPTPEMMTPVEPEKRGGLLDFLFRKNAP